MSQFESDAPTVSGPALPGGSAPQDTKQAKGGGRRHSSSRNRAAKPKIVAGEPEAPTTEATTPVAEAARGAPGRGAPGRGTSTSRASAAPRSATTTPATPTEPTAPATAATEGEAPHAPTRPLRRPRGGSARRPGVALVLPPNEEKAAAPETTITPAIEASAPTVDATPDVAEPTTTAETAPPAATPPTRRYRFDRHSPITSGWGATQPSARPERLSGAETASARDTSDASAIVAPSPLDSLLSALDQAEAAQSVAAQPALTQMAPEAPLPQREGSQLPARGEAAQDVLAREAAQIAASESVAETAEPAEAEAEAADAAESSDAAATRRRRRRRRPTGRLASAEEPEVDAPALLPSRQTHQPFDVGDYSAHAEEPETDNGYDAPVEEPYTPYAPYTPGMRDRGERGRAQPAAQQQAWSMANAQQQINEPDSPFASPEPTYPHGFGPQPRGVAVPAREPFGPRTNRNERGLDAPPISANQLASVISNAIAQQTDRLLSELRRQATPPTMTLMMPATPSTERIGVFVDVANLVYSARSMRFNLDFGRLLEFLRGNRRLIRAHAYAPTNPDPGADQSFLAAVKGVGYRITTKNYKTFASGAKKADMDLDMCMDIVRLVDSGAIDTLILVSGDSDFLPVLEYCSDKGVRNEVAAFDDSAAAILRQSCDLFVNLTLVDSIRGL